MVVLRIEGARLTVLSTGGLSLALGEQCWFHANHSEVIKDPMNLIRKRFMIKNKQTNKLKETTTKREGMNLYSIDHPD